MSDSASPLEDEKVNFLPNNLQHLLTSAAGVNVENVSSFWLEHKEQGDIWDINSFIKLARWLVEEGEPFVAFDVAVEGVKFIEGLTRAGGLDLILGQELSEQGIELLQIQSLALARTGSPEEAQKILQPLRDEGDANEETLGLLARTHKDLGCLATDPCRKEKHFHNALEIYKDAHRVSKGYWTGINVATLLLFLGQKDQACIVAKEVRAQCLENLQNSESDKENYYWLLATLGEAALIREEWQEAESWYRKAVENCKGEWANVSSTRKQARLIMDCYDHDPEMIEMCLRIPAVVVFVGHMVDQPDREDPRFPTDIETYLKPLILDRLRSLNGGFGYSSGACGSDLIFQECMREVGGKTNLILPYPEVDFIKDSVDLIPGSNWKLRFEESRKKAVEVVTASAHRLIWGGVTYDYANQLLLGSAIMRAEQLETDLLPMAVWNGQPGDGPGGTESVVERWRKLGHTVEIIRLDELLREVNSVTDAKIDHSPASVLPPFKVPLATPLNPEIRAILFADMKGFSGLHEEHMASFLHHILRVIGEYATETQYTPRVRNSWGDGLFCVFDEVSHAAMFALELRDRLEESLLEKKGEVDGFATNLPEGLAWRIGLHAGPVFPCIDPITAHPTYLGAHVNVASRIEPVTPPGEINVSWAFAALARAEKAGGFSCDYAGIVPGAKFSGPIRMYRLRRN